MVTKANWGIALTLLLGCVFTAISIVAGSRKDELTKASDRQQEEKVAQFGAMAADARERSARLEVTAEQARTEQKRLEVRIGEQQGENLKLQARVEQEQIERLKLEQQLAPRRLTEQQKQTLYENLKPFPKPVLSFLVFNSSPEVLEFAGTIQDVFVKLGWLPSRATPTIAFDPQSARGMGVGVKSQAEHPAAAEVLIKSLRDMGFHVEADANARFGPNDIHLFFSSK